MDARAVDELGRKFETMMDYLDRIVRETND